MPQSDIEICNIALAAIGESSIRSFSNDNSRSRMCDTFYKSLRDYLISRFDWPFARKFAFLNELDLTAVDVPDGYRGFAIPADCLTPRDIDPRGSKIYWTLSGEALFVKATQSLGQKVGLHYTVQVLNVRRFSETFANTLALGLAARLAPPLSQDPELAKTLYIQFQNELRESSESDANIGNEFLRPDRDPDRDSFVYPEGINLDDLDIFRLR